MGTVAGALRIGHMSIFFSIAVTLNGHWMNRCKLRATCSNSYGSVCKDRNRVPLFQEIHNTENNKSWVSIGKHVVRTLVLWQNHNIYYEIYHFSICRKLTIIDEYLLYLLHLRDLLAPTTFTHPIRSGRRGTRQIASAKELHTQVESFFCQGPAPQNTHTHPRGWPNPFWSLGRLSKHGFAIRPGDPMEAWSPLNGWYKVALFSFVIVVYCLMEKLHWPFSVF